ncbi:bifunctional DNA-formamidopyrimidine glycosylase/DNA-(apurinic or apyrimidinic site) lyase [Aestuariirhabdus litorea]|uniref:Formamidopyrimidine-DNA glycosylase n=1 Tax=Aestuariirhabdus litorea TaxID=2528527 RepID=A0A3P3VPD4_9GAMM|nr:bifunctional DNA-formamidopyrimidine glycosylase/DNA-(apurinic or apyrimidinic site) lyase [Aestuariirhabdus litorea]RRJ82673.1 bifunctional DNA-formamidopyrimidine glycosylase/DNA-(apurinic or apyrimidinic site) lyase [Aestuariirhabdus litorea]RWW92833.1 bifunctional DNA-formamidopyrimidine glycosylase/DNA-(apurinic or apyrimidinic site) lyase [Endozoicomonadaceae bacterium GTF-13]
MPELPEVETTRRGIAPYLEGAEVEAFEVREPRLRWPVEAAIAGRIQGQRVERVERRGKYLLVQFAEGTLLIHLGMSGSLRVLMRDTPPGKHDHVDICLKDGHRIRFCDPRRFGAMVWTESPASQHRLLASLGPEPLGSEFDGDYLYRRSRGRRSPIKSWLMDSHVVVGVGNIYANEALFQAGIDPRRAAGRVSRQRMRLLATAVREVLASAIEQGGTTLRDFVGGDGKPGYFSQQLHVYGRGGQPCTRCGEALVGVQLAQRSTVYCRYCQR